MEVFVFQEAFRGEALWEDLEAKSFGGWRQRLAGTSCFQKADNSTICLEAFRSLS